MLDGAGHTIQTQLQTDPSGADDTDRTYDGLGRLWTVSNPYRSTSDPTYGLTTYVYDALGRPTSVTTADGAATVTSYSGTSSTVTDPAGKSRTSTMDALGRLTQVIESPNASPYTTSYGYDSLNNLLSVNQSGRTRAFSYDSLSRLTSATNPETGTICYGLVSSGTCQGNDDGDGNLLNRPDARGIVTSYAYDALNRIVSKSYSDGTPGVSYGYDTGGNGIGRLTPVSVPGITTSSGAFDAMGRVIASSQTLLGQTYAFGYAYNLAGALTSEVYPSGRTVATGYDGAGRAAWVQGTQAGATTHYVGNPAVRQHGPLLAAWRDLLFSARQHGVVRLVVQCAAAADRELRGD